MNKKIIICSSLLIINIFANAEEKPSNQCSVLFSEMPYLELLGNPAIEDIPEGCRLLNGVLAPNHYSSWKFSSMDITGKELTSALSQNQTPSALALSIKDIQFSVTHNPVVEYITAAQQEPFDIQLSYEWHNKILTITEFSLKSDYLGDVIFQAQIGLSSLPTKDWKELPSPLDISVNNFSIELTNKRFFQSFVVPTLISSLSPEEDIPTQVETYRQQAVSAIDSLQPQMADESTKTALKNFVQSFPKPQGTTRLSVTLEPAMTLDKFDNPSFTKILQLINQITLKASYDPNSLLNRKENCQ